ncbi:unnamed protein product [Prunus brigantina]
MMFSTYSTASKATLLLQMSLNSTHMGSLQMVAVRELTAKISK